MSYFDKIKEHYMLKKEKQEQFYVVEEEKQDAVHFLVEQKALELMFVDTWELKSLINCNYVKSMGWHEEGQYILDRLVLTNEGKTLYDLFNIKKKSSRYIKTLDKLNKGASVDNLLMEKRDILLYYRIYGISKIYKYEEWQDQNNKEKARSL